MRRLLFAVTVLFVFATGVAHADALVTVGHNRVEPAELSVAVGDAVTFRNEDAMPGGHTIVADDGSFESPGLAQGEEWSHTFDTKGSHGYKIKQHPSATGKIHVE